MRAKTSAAGGKKTHVVKALGKKTRSKANTLAKSKAKLLNKPKAKTLEKKIPSFAVSAGQKKDLISTRKYSRRGIKGSVF